MRHKKFRIWNGIEMVYDILVGKFGVFYINPGDNGTGLDPNDSASLTPFNTKYSDTVPVMQNIERKDQRGKEIYEDDIYEYEIKIENYDELDELNPRYYNVPRFEYKKIKHVVSYDLYSLQIINSYEGKVIGNIHTTPDLLK